MGHFLLPREPRDGANAADVVTAAVTPTPTFMNPLTRHSLAACNHGPKPLIVSYF